MNSESWPISRILHNHPDSPPHHNFSAPLWDHVRNPAVLGPLLVLALTLVYQTLLQSGRILPLLRLIFDAIVFLIPAPLLHAVDDALDPVPLFLTRDPAPAGPASPASFFAMPSRHSRAHHAAKRKVARRILGRTRATASIMKFVSEASKPSLGLFGLGVHVANRNDPLGDVPPGLGNPTNYCYQNSILQALASLEPLPDYLRSLPVLGESAEQQANRCCASWTSGSLDKGRTGEALRKLLAQLNDPANRGKTLWTPGILKNMSTWQQQDAQEYFSKLLDQIDDEAATAARKLGIVKSPHFGFLTPQKEHDLFPPTHVDDAASSRHSDDSGYRSISPPPDMPRGAANAKEPPRLSRNPVEGLLTQRVVCISCGFTEGLSMEPFNCITVELGQTSGHHVNITDRLDGYTNLETVEGVHCPKCTLIKFRKVIMALTESSREKGLENAVAISEERLEAIDDALENDDFSDEALSKKCKVPPKQRVDSTKTKQRVVARPPQSLVIHVNRSVFDEDTGFLYKNSATVRFPKTLDLGPWCLGSADLPGEAERDEDEAITIPGGLPHHNTKQHPEHWVLHPEVSMVAGAQGHSRITGPVYELRAVVTHHGRHDNGHYVCYRRMRRPAKGEQREAEKGEAGNNEDKDDVSTHPSSTPSPIAGDGVDPMADALGVNKEQDKRPNHGHMNEAEAAEELTDRDQMDEDEKLQVDEAKGGKLDEAEAAAETHDRAEMDEDTEGRLDKTQHNKMDDDEKLKTEDVGVEDLADDEMADTNAKDEDTSPPSSASLQTSPRAGSVQDGASRVDSPSVDQTIAGSPDCSGGINIVGFPWSSGASSPIPQGDLHSAEEDEYEWWCMSDEDVVPVSLQNVLSQGGVFMLFYTCIDPASVPTGDVDRHTIVMDEKMAAAAAMNTAGDAAAVAGGQEQEKKGRQTVGVPSIMTEPPATPATPVSPDSALFPADGGESTLVIEESEAEMVQSPASQQSLPSSSGGCPGRRG